MPLFHDPGRRRQDRRFDDSEIKCEQLTTGSPPSQVLEESHHGPSFTGIADLDGHSSAMEFSCTTLGANDRRELIHRIKDSTPWRHRYMNPQDSGSGMDFVSHNSPEALQVDGCVQEITPDIQNYRPKAEKLGSPADIQRPRSALHSGDFREGDESQFPQPTRPRFADPTLVSPFPHLGTSPTTPWLSASAFPTERRHHGSCSDRGWGNALATRSRAPSLGSFSSSYVLKAPTSPLVHQANNTDLDFSPRVDSKKEEPTTQANRRRTLPPETFRYLQSSHSGLQTLDFQSNIRDCRLLGVEGASISHLEHLPGRSLASTYNLQLASTGNTATSRARRPSFASDVSTRPHAPMVGSYEESILRGRMSMNPSKPLDFTAQIGVLGKGKCKGHLRCPPHVTVPFPAVFYSYPTSGSGRSISDDSPSPYVGHIDLENSLERDEPNSMRRRRKQRRNPSPGQDADEPGARRVPDAGIQRRREKQNRRTESSKCPPGGCYRIPQQGQLQIIIKNPHKTAVKLFLVPYDLSDMEPGNKTFIRQRSYSAGPFIDMPLSARKNFGTDRPEASLNATEDPRDKPTLRYLIHLNICCPARGRFYLHSSIRVVFANRVPDGKEKLRNEIQLPEPRYSPYRPARDSNPPSSVNSRLALERAPRRRSAGQGTIPAIRPHVSSPSDIPLRQPTAPSIIIADTSQFSSEAGEPSYSKLNRGDNGYRDYPFLSQRSSNTSESLLAKRLRGLDVHMREKFDH